MVRPIFSAYRLKPFRLTCGWPVTKGLSRKQRRIGECHFPKAVNGFHDIFISPLLDDSVDVAGVVCHELAHVAAGFDAGHGPKFVKVCKHVGLTKNKPISADPGEHLKARLVKIVGQLGPYPHTKIVPLTKPVKPKKEITVQCPDCGCKVRISVKWLAAAGSPVCGSCDTPMVSGGGEDDE
jgi:hypothetical protein